MRRCRAAADGRVAVAASGGRDSTALLHCHGARRARRGRARCVALHVHHGLHARRPMPGCAQCSAQCRRWARAGCRCSLPARRRRPHAATASKPGRAASAMPRLARLAREAGCSAGAAGPPPARPGRDLAAAGAARRRAGRAWRDAARAQCATASSGRGPGCDQPREAIEAYVRRHRLRFVDDASNADPRFARNRLRQRGLAGADAGVPARPRPAWPGRAPARQRGRGAACDELAAPTWPQPATARRSRSTRLAGAGAARGARNCLRAWLRGVCAAAGARSRWCSACCTNCRAARRALAGAGRRAAAVPRATASMKPCRAAAGGSAARRAELDLSPARRSRRCRSWGGTLRGAAGCGRRRRRSAPGRAAAAPRAGRRAFPARRRQRCRAA